MNKKLLTLGTILSAGLLMGGVANAAEKKFDVRVTPVALLFGAIDVEGSMKITYQITVGPMFTYWGTEVGDDEFSMSGYGARVNWHQNGAYKTGFYAGAYAKYWSFDISTTTVDFFSGATTTASGSIGATLFGALGGYMWQWDSLNLSLGAGYAIGSVGDAELKDSSGTVQDTVSGSDVPVSGMTFDAAIGWAF